MILTLLARLPFVNVCLNSIRPAKHDHHRHPGRAPHQPGHMRHHIRIRGPHVHTLQVHHPRTRVSLARSQVTGSRCSNVLSATSSRKSPSSRAFNPATYARRSPITKTP